MDERREETLLQILGASALYDVSLDNLKDAFQRFFTAFGLVEEDAQSRAVLFISIARCLVLDSIPLEYIDEFWSTVEKIVSVGLEQFADAKDEVHDKLAPEWGTESAEELVEVLNRILSGDPFQRDT